MTHKYKGWASKAEYRAAQVAAHNAEFERLQARTPEERDEDFRTFCRDVAKDVSDSARESLFGNGKPKKIKRWK